MVGWVLALSPSALAADLLVGPGQAYSTVQGAVAAANPGDRVVVDPGTYVEQLSISERDLEIIGGPGVVIEIVPGAGQILRISSSATVTLVDLELDALGLGRVFDIDDATLVGNGLTIRGGSGTDGGAIEAGGGSLIHLEGGSVTGSAQRGGVVYADDTTVELIDVDIDGASATSSGGVADIDSVTFLVQGGTWTGVSAPSGGAVSSTGSTVTLTGLTITGSSATTGSLITASLAASFEMTDTTLIGNSAADNLVTLSSVQDATFRRDLLCGNSSPVHLVRYSASAGRFENNVVLNNVLDGSGLSASGSATVVDVVNNDFVSNATAAGGSAIEAESGATVSAVNNLVAYERDVSSPPVDGTGGALAFTYGLLFDNQPDHTTGVVLDATTLVGIDPGFAEPADGDCSVAPLQPAASDPVVDAGDPTLTDDDGSPSDIGAFGGPNPFPAEPTGDDDDDDDCNVTVDVYADADLDGFGSGSPVSTCDPEPDDVLVGGDCDDSDPAVNPSAAEVCNAIDDDCDGETDEGLLLDAYVDVDGDGYGAGTVVKVCAFGPGLVAEANDCNDTDASVWPGALESRDDDIDQDCDGVDLVTHLGGVAGCGCATSAPGSAWLLGALGVLAASRSRRRA